MSIREGDIDYAPVWAGLSIDHATDVKPAREIVAELVRETEDALGRDAREDLG